MPGLDLPGHDTFSDANGAILQVRTGVSVDIPEVLSVWSSAEAEPTVTDDKASIGVLLARDPDSLLVAEIASTLVGTVIAGWDGWRGHLYRLAVLPSHRRSGVATTLVEAAEARLGDLGARRLNAIVAEDQAWATGFWTAAGYRAQSQRLRFVKNL
jgi:ribosomal protein S18 acetylase RimI-like enzyme